MGRSGGPAGINLPHGTSIPRNTGTAEQDISSVVTGAHDFAETIQSAGVYALLAVAAAINRLADAVQVLGEGSPGDHCGGGGGGGSPSIVPASAAQT